MEKINLLTIRWSQILYLFEACENDEAIVEFWNDFVGAISIRDNIDFEVSNKNMLSSLRYISGYYDSDKSKYICQIILMLERRMTNSV